MPSDLPTPVRTLLDALVARTLAPSAELRSRVTDHLRAARKAAAQSALVDLDLAERTAAGCLALLDTYDSHDATERHLIQAACLYFTESDDDEDDFRSVIGFEDDAEVLNHVAARLGRDDLLVELP